MMSATVSYQKTIPVRHEVDVFVAGGGPSGVAAALVAAREGRSVFLAESHTCLGGMGTAGLVPGFCQFGDGVNFLAAGIGSEIDRLLTAEKGEVITGTARSIPAEPMKRVYDRLMLEAGVNFTFHTHVVDVVSRDGALDMAICSAKSGFFAVKAKMFIDGTGEGDLAAFAGAKFEKGDVDGSTMPGTLCSVWADVDYDKYLEAKPDRRALLFQAFEDGVFTVNDPHHPGMWRLGRHLAGGNIGHAFGVDASDERSLTHFLVEGRQRMPEFERFYREYMPGFEKLVLVQTGSLLGIRENRRIIGDYVLNVDDFIARAVFPDEIGRYCYPVDIHPSQPSAEKYAAFEKEFREQLRYSTGESYGIPYRILTPIGFSNLLVGGRCVSCDRKIQGSIRVIPGCYITGQAAGMAAAIAIENNTDTRGFPVSELQRRLLKMGAFLPNYKG
ncbi:MAG TPA: FAD-dependent oxidoreductase [Lentisphaeria bacterium]|nr:FAD-dependent oxidoreductase [Lentisphaerota bacterium]HPY89614.1 FAD-dependent oxidoreductase [Lentisphaeria bacterium]HQC53686.1 FAD-dependent oxidoreductase [Lentisphaeria bacterium]HQL86157.1 FAD-dependent oxidoreductase [Lentisphaeria bacterium]